MATRNIVPRAGEEGYIGKLAKRWLGGFFKKLDVANGNKSPVHTLQRETTYALNDVAFHSGINARYFLKCTTAGTTGSVEPDFSSVTSDSTVADGTVVWTVKTLGAAEGFVEYLPLAGGTMTGSIQYVDNGKVFVIGNTGPGKVDLGWNWVNRDGAGIGLRSADHASPGEFILFAMDSANSCSLVGKPGGYLAWDNKEIERVSAKGTHGIRFESGLQICWGTLSIPAGTSGREVSGTMTFPYPFANANYVLSFGNDWLSSSTEYYRAEGRNTGNFKFTAVGVNTNSHKAFYVAIGYWK